MKMISMSCQEFINRNFSDNQLGRGFHNAFLQYRIHISFLAIRIDWIFSYFQMVLASGEKGHSGSGKKGQLVVG